MRLVRFLPVIACVPLLFTHGAPRAQGLSPTYANLARDPVGDAEPLRACGTPTDHALRGRMAVGEPMADGDAIRGEQFPRFLTPTHAGEFGFDSFTVLGDHETLTFERHDPNQAASSAIETWRRTGTSSVSGRLVSVFRLVWRPEALRATLGDQSGGASTVRTCSGGTLFPVVRRVNRFTFSWRHQTCRRPKWFRSATRCSSRAMRSIFGSRASVMRASRAATGRGGFPGWRRRSYEHFADAYDTIAVVTQSREHVDALGFHRNVRNGVAGIGLELFDDTAEYGSASVLQGVELFPSPRWAENAAALHQQAHQWSEYTGAWATAGVVRRGDAPLTHTPLLTPGAVMAGAVLEATRRVEATSLGGASYTIEQTLPTVEFSPLTLYRMGVVASSELPVGVRLDGSIPGRISVGQTMRVNGALTLTDRNDYNIVCLRFFRYGSSDVNETFVCASLSGRRFSIPVSFSAGQEGTYTIEPFAFWPNSGPQAALSRYGTIVVGAGG